MRLRCQRHHTRGSQHVHAEYRQGAQINVSATANAGAIEITDPERAKLIEMRERALAAKDAPEALPAPEGEDTERYVEITERETARERGEAAPPLPLPLRQLPDKRRP